MSEPRHIAQQLSTEQLTRIAVAALEDIKAKDITVLEVGHLSSLFETMIIASGDSNRQVAPWPTTSAEEARRPAARSSASRAKEDEARGNGCWWTPAAWWCTSCIPALRCITTWKNSGARQGR
jgi:ribosomal silencing factor RsfS